jgi:hypothetical protein
MAEKHKLIITIDEDDPDLDDIRSKKIMMIIIKN